MNNTTVYFTDNFFSAGLTTIYNENKQEIGSLNLNSMFTSSVDVLDQNDQVVVKGRFPFFSRKWSITDHNDHEIGRLKQRLSFFSKSYEYEAYGRGIFVIHSEAFSKDYEISSEDEEVIATFRRISGFFTSPAFQLTNHSKQLENEELIAIVMGVNMIRKRNSAAAANSSASH